MAVPFGFAVLILFAWYFFTDHERVKRILGSVLTVGIAAFCLWSINPPNDKLAADGKTLLEAGKIRRGLDLKGGTTFLIRLVAEPNDKGEKKDINVRLGCIKYGPRLSIRPSQAYPNLPKACG